MKHTRRLTQDALTQIIEALQGARDFIFWGEDANGLGNTPEKRQIDKTIDWFQQRKTTAPVGAFRLVQTWDCYRDYEPMHSEEINGWRRITFNDTEHTAYASLFNQESVFDNTKHRMSGETVPLEWNDAVRIVFGAPGPVSANTPAKAANTNVPPNCPQCYGETEFGPDTKHFTCFHCGATGPITR